MFFRRRNETGQALAETVIILPILFLFIAGIVQFSQITTVQRRLLMAARYGVWLYARGQEPDVVEGAIIEFLRDGSPSLEDWRIEVECKKRWHFGDVKDLRDFSEAMNDKVTVTYKLRVIPFLRPVFKKDVMILEEKCVVAGGTWYWGFPMW